MACTGRQKQDVASMNGELVSAFPAQDQSGLTAGEAKDLMRRGVVVVEGVDAVSPLWRPAVSQE